MATEDAHTTLHTELNTIVRELNHTNKARRRKALEKLHNLTFERESKADQEAQTNILECSLRHLITCLADQSEVNRIKASEIILCFIQNVLLKQDHLVHLIPAMHHRLATLPTLEQSEDVRLVQINILSTLASQFQGGMVPYINDAVNILREGVVDGCPEVRKAAAECVSCLAKATKEKFHMQSESLVKPLLKALHHQRFRNRIASITALGTVCQLLCSIVYNLQHFTSSGWPLWLMIYT